MNLLSLYAMFFKFGCVSFGGGYVLIPMIITELVEKRGIMTADEFANLTSIAQMTPGPIGINTATYVGFISCGTVGAVTASVALVTPSLILGILWMKYVGKYKESIIVKGILTGVRPAAFALIVQAALIFLGLSVFTAGVEWNRIAAFFMESGGKIFPNGTGISPAGLAICAVSVVLMLKTKIPMIPMIIGSMIAGALIFGLTQ